MRVCPGCRTVYEEHIAVCPKDGLPLIDRSPTFARIKEGEDPEDKDEDTAVKPGLMIGEYQVEGVIAEGGMGVIYQGIHPLIRKRVAIKVLNKRFAQDPKAVSRFVLEARSVNEIGHHNIVDIFSIGELDDQRNYLIMEFLDGLALHEILLKVKRLKPAEITPIYEQLCDALKLAHAKEFVHRDLKPDNVIVLRRPPYPFIKILDFGLAKLRGSITSSNTEVGTVLGTPEYMAPEQCRGDAVDARTDIYALGVMLYELLTGRRPFTDKSPFRVLAMQQREMPKSPSQYAPVSEAMEWIVARAMAKHPNQRFQSVGELMEHLNRATTERLPWTIDLDPVEVSMASPAALDPEPVVEVSAPVAMPGRRQGFSVPRPIAISDEMSDDDIETMVAADSRPGMEQPEEILKMLRKEGQVQEIRGDVDSDVVVMPSVRNVRLAPVEARAPAPLLGTPGSGELEDMGATEVSDPPEVTGETDVSGQPAPAPAAEKPAEPPKEASAKAEEEASPQPAEEEPTPIKEVQPKKEEPPLEEEPTAVEEEPTPIKEPAPQEPAPVQEEPTRPPLAIPPEEAQPSSRDDATQPPPPAPPPGRPRRASVPGGVPVPRHAYPPPGAEAPRKSGAVRAVTEAQLRAAGQRRSGPVPALTPEKAAQATRRSGVAPVLDGTGTPPAADEASSRRSGSHPAVSRTTPVPPPTRAAPRTTPVPPQPQSAPAPRRSGPLPLVDRDGKAQKQERPIAPQRTEPLTNRVPAMRKLADELPLFDKTGEPQDAPSGEIDAALAALDIPAKAPKDPTSELLVDVPPAELRGLKEKVSAQQGGGANKPKAKAEEPAKVESGVYSLQNLAASERSTSPPKPVEEIGFAQTLLATEQPKEVAEALASQQAVPAQPETDAPTQTAAPQQAQWSQIGAGPVTAGSAARVSTPGNKSKRTLLLIVVSVVAAVAGAAVVLSLLL